MTSSLCLLHSEFIKEQCRAVGVIPVEGKGKQLLNSHEYWNVPRINWCSLGAIPGHCFLSLPTMISVCGTKLFCSFCCLLSEKQIEALFWEIKQGGPKAQLSHSTLRASLLCRGSWCRDPCPKVLSSLVGAVCLHSLGSAEELPRRNNWERHVSAHGVSASIWRGFLLLYFQPCHRELPT